MNEQSNFTPQQLQAIYRDPGNTVVFASPGSGKTTVLTHHIAFVLLSKMLTPQEVMAVTFTKQAAADLKLRLSQVGGLRPQSIEPIQTGTFHAQIFHILLQTMANIPVLLSPSEQYHMLTKAIRRAGVPQNGVQRWQSTITKVKAVWPLIFPPGIAGEILRHYERIKTKSGRWDFDDILLRFCDTFCGTDKRALMPTVRYLLVDEFQDTNSVQAAILQYFSKTFHIPIFVVGDDDQSIYGFRGASPSWLLDFHHSFNPAQQFQLSTNFRSDRRIVAHAATLIQHNKNRRYKDLAVASRVEGICITIYHENEEAEANTILKMLLSNRHDPRWSVTVLARTRRQLLRVWKVTHNVFPYVQYRTFHDAKGKEWDCVHVLGCVENNPYLARADSGDEEEERRLMYVAMTRARHALYLHVPLRSNGTKVLPSQFLLEAECLPRK